MLDVTSIDNSRLDALSPIVLSVFRVVVGVLFAIHGAQLLFAWPVGMDGGPAVPGGTWPLWYAGVIELVVGLLLTVGLFTRLAALIGSGAMAFGYFVVHAPVAFWPIQNGGEPAVLFCFGLLLLVFTGGGKLTVDRLVAGKRPVHTDATLPAAG
jgi:putative oxidoreductase